MNRGVDAADEVVNERVRLLEGSRDLDLAREHAVERVLGETGPSGDVKVPW